MLKYSYQIIVAIILFCLGITRFCVNGAGSKWISIVNLIGMCVALGAVIWSLIIEKIKQKMEKSFRIFVGGQVIIFFIVIAIISFIIFSSWIIPDPADDLVTLFALFFSICPDVLKSIVIRIWRLD